MKRSSCVCMFCFLWVAIGVGQNILRTYRPTMLRQPPDTIGVGQNIPKKVAVGDSIEKIQHNTSVDPVGRFPINVGEKYMPILYLADTLVNLVLDDWFPLGDPQTNAFDFGRIQTIPTYNHMEGFRLRGGVASTTRFHPHFFLKGYMAYGFKDEKLKCRGEATLSFNNPLYHEDEFPKNNLSVIYENEVYPFAELHPRSTNDAVLYAYKHSENAMAYRDFLEFRYEKETLWGFAAQAWVRTSTVKPGEGFSFTSIETDNEQVAHKNVKTGEVGISFRYTPGATYFQYRRKRELLTYGKPIFTVSYTKGLNGFLGGKTAYDRVEVSIQERFAIGDYGRFNTSVDVQRVWGLLPFPLLLYPNQQSKNPIENSAFYCTPSIEFVGDKQYALRTTFKGNRWLLYRVPVFRKWGTKELITLRAVYGTLKNKNMPTPENGLFVFPEATTVMTKTPYIEASIGAINVMGFFRVEYVHRFTYRNNPPAIRGSLRFDVSL